VPTRQRRPALAALALVLVLGGAALSAFLVLNSGQKQSVLVVARDVEFGHVFETSDFREGQISFSVPNTQPIRFNQMAELVGRRYKATVPIRQGTLLTANMITTRPLVPAGNYASLGLNVEEGLYPAGLIAGDAVKVLYTPTSDKGVPAGGVKNGTPLALGRTLIEVAYVTSVGSAAAGQGSIVVTLVIENKNLEQLTQDGMPIVAAANALDSITLVKLPESIQPETGGGQ